MDKNKLIDEYFNTKWNFIDFFYGYCSSKGIDDPENDLTDEEYDQMEKECEKQITADKLRRLREVVVEEINERLTMIWEDESPQMERRHKC